jgi:hypothetical protein
VTSIALFGCASSTPPAVVDASAPPTEELPTEGEGDEAARRSSEGVPAETCGREETIQIDAGRVITIPLPCRPFDPKVDIPDPPPRAPPAPLLHAPVDHEHDEAIDTRRRTDMPWSRADHR